MVISTKNFFPVFYDNFKCILWSTTICLTIPLFARAADQYLLSYNQGYKDLYYGHIIYANCIYAVFSTLIPIITQMASLIFGALSKKTNSGRNRDLSEKINMLGGSGEQVDNS